MLDELEDNVVSRVIQAVGLFGDILSLEDTMEPILSERLQSKTDAVEKKDESKNESDEQQNGKIEREGLTEELKKSGKMEGGEDQGDLIEMGLKTGDHKVELGEGQEKNGGAGREEQTSAEIQGDVGCSERQTQEEIEKEDQAEMEQHLCQQVSSGTDREDSEKDVLEGERGKEQESEMAVQESDGEFAVQQLVEEGKEEGDQRVAKMQNVEKGDKTKQKVSAGIEGCENVHGQEKSGGKECDVEGTDLKLKDLNLLQGKKIEKNGEEDEVGAEEKPEIDNEEEDERQEGVKSREQSELPVKSGVETRSNEDQQQEDEGDKTIEKGEDIKQELERVQQNNEKMEEQEQNESTEDTISTGDEKKKEASKVEEAVRQLEEGEEEGSKRMSGEKEKHRKEEDEFAASSTAPEMGRRAEVLEAVPAVEEGSKADEKHSQGVYPAPMGHHNDPIEKEVEEKWDVEDEGGDEQENKKVEAPDQTKPTPLRDADVESAEAPRESSQQVKVQQREGLLQAQKTSLSVAPEPMSGKLVPYMEPLKWM